MCYRLLGAHAWGVGGNRFLYGIRVLNCDYSCVPRVLSTSYDSSCEPALFVHFWLRRGRMVLRPHLYCLPSRFTLVRSLYWVLDFCGVRPRYCCVGDAAPITAPILLLALRSAAVVAFFSPVSRFSR